MLIDIRNNSDPRDAIHQAVNRLSEGELVGLPTETFYAVCALGTIPAAVSQLNQLVENKDQTLAVKNSDEALDFAPEMTALGQKLSRRCWPGPVTIHLPIDASKPSLLTAISEETRQAVTENQHLRVRVPDDPVFRETLRLLPAPLVVSSESSCAFSTAQQIYEQFDDSISMILDNGPARYAEPSTVIRVSDTWETISAGVVSETVLNRLTGELYLFVCTGNTCRSPMAEGLFRNLLCEKLQCTEEELIDRGYIVTSAGLAAATGSPPSPESVEVLKTKGIDLRAHESQPLTNELLNQADHIYALTRMHQLSIIEERPDVEPRVELLSREGDDISDPIGGGMDEYIRCEQEIEKNIRQIISEIL